MIKEIYCRMPGDTGYDPKRLEIDNDAEQILQRVRVCLGTKPGQVLGDPLFGIDLEDYIFDMSVDVDDIENRVRALLVQYALAGFEDEFTIDVKAYFGKNTTDASDYILLDIYLNDQKALGVIIS